ncbi:MAG: hypothetical protein HC919_02765 [Oscillatoriales cyanobacterium SM2_2_1]|nr:hypothetical protein [Oscillatoriales cyanobacterium SM2_2_1]
MALFPIKKEPQPQSSETLRRFRETLKDILQEITTLDVTTMVVREIPCQKFEPESFCRRLLHDIRYQTREGLKQIAEELASRSASLQQQGLATQSQAPFVQDAYRKELIKYNLDLERYQEAERRFLEQEDDAQRRSYQDFLQLAYRQILDLELRFDAQGEPRLSSIETRVLRKLWELELTLLHEDVIFAQTTLHLDGDLTNRYRRELFDRRVFAPETTQMILQLHHTGVENAEKQWNGLIQLVVGLIERLIPFRRPLP